MEQFTITIDDGTSTPITKTISVTITGTNDVPVFTSEDVSGVINETMGTPADSQSLTDSGIIKFTDVDLSDTHAVSATGTFVPVTPGDVALGTLTAVLDSDIDHTTGQASTSSSNSRLRSMTGRAPRSPRRFP
ncbi:MAG: VCBS domain-containing protein [Afipia sp.]|nr:VCBS domain-containing protein [Afipia sp.]